ncbi:MAG: hypothetical protein ACI8P3_000009 [Saprospiraceae bacterium]|jgi:hypothetical protein
MKNVFKIFGIAVIFLALLVPQSSYGQVTIGDIHEGGIVFQVSDDGMSGLVIQAEDIGGKENKMDWDAAVAACEKLGNGWYLPSIEELKLASKNLKTMGGGDRYNTKLSQMINYWSATELKSDWAMAMSFNTPWNMGEWQCQKKGGTRFNNIVRAVRAF